MKWIGVVGLLLLGGCQGAASVALPGAITQAGQIATDVELAPIAHCFSVVQGVNGMVQAARVGTPAVLR